jgi:hypothetical protein
MMMTSSDRLYVRRGLEAKARYAKDGNREPPYGEDDYEALLSRASRAWHRECTREGDIYQQPSENRSQVEKHNGRLYVCLRDDAGVLKAYRVRNDGRLKGLVRPPAAIAI